MLHTGTNWISIKLNDLKIAQFLYSDIGSQHIGNNFMSSSIISKNVAAINSGWAAAEGNAKSSNIQLSLVH